MNSLVGQRLWKWTLVAGGLTIVLGAIVLAWPGPTILVARRCSGSTCWSAVWPNCLWRHPARIGGHPGDAVHQRRTVAGVGHLVVPPLRRRLCGASAVAVDRNRVHLPRRFRGRRRPRRERAARPRLVRSWPGIISVLAGLVVLVWPFDSIAVLTLAAGIWLVIIGITQNRASIPNPQSRQHRTTHHLRSIKPGLQRERLTQKVGDA